MSRKFSIRQKFLFIVFISLGLCSVIITAVVIKYMSHSAVLNAEKNFESSISSYKENIELRFMDSIKDGQLLAKMIAQWYQRSDISEWNEYFTEKYYFDKDNAIRTKFSEDDISGIFVSNIGKFNDRVRKMIIKKI